MKIEEIKDSYVFKTVDDEWLDFILKCRDGFNPSYDIIEGPMADDRIYNYIDDYKNGDITREQFYILAGLPKSTHQIAFLTDKALASINFLESGDV